MKNIALALALVAGLFAPLAIAAENIGSTTPASGGMGCCQSCCCKK